MAAMENASAAGNSSVLRRTLAELVVGTSVVVLVIVMTIVGNILVVLSIFTYRPLKKIQNFFLVSLAAADLAVALLVMPLHVVKFVSGDWLFGLIMCQMWLTCDVLLCTASILNLCAIALDRYWAITNPIGYANQRTKRLVLSMTGSVWVISVVISVPPLFGWNDWSKQAHGDCEYTTDQGYVVYSACGSFYIPLLIMATVYAKIFIAARSRLRKRSLPKMNSFKEHGKKVSQLVRCTSRTNELFVSADECQLTLDDGLPMALEHSALTDMSSVADHSGSNELAHANVPRRGSMPQPPGLEDDTLLQLARKKTSSRPPLAAKQQSFKRHPSTMSTDSRLHTFFKEKEKISITKEKKAAKTLAIIMGVFVLCWLPFFLLYIINPFCDCVIHPKIFETTNWLGYINSSLNPIIYTIFNLDFRQAFARILTKRWWTRHMRRICCF